MAFVVTKLIRGEVEVVKPEATHLDERMIVAPEVAIGQAKREIVRMFNFAKEELESANWSAFARTARDREDLFEKLKRREEAVNHLEREISIFLIKIGQQPITEEQSRTTAAYLHLMHDIERIGDIAENIMDLVALKAEDNIKFSETAEGELRELSNYVEKAVTLTVDAFDRGDKETAEAAVELEGKIDATEQSFRNNHIRRLGEGTCDPRAGVIFLDILSNLERAGDHADNIAVKVLELDASLS
jgi:phosphate:Na+ symporter